MAAPSCTPSTVIVDGKRFFSRAKIHRQLAGSAPDGFPWIDPIERGCRPRTLTLTVGRLV